jgi:hypothetical protein
VQLPAPPAALPLRAADVATAPGGTLHVALGCRQSAHQHEAAVVEVVGPLCALGAGGAPPPPLLVVQGRVGLSAQRGAAGVRRA